MHHITRTRSCIWPVSTWKKTCQQKKGWLEAMTLVSRHSWVTRYTTSENWFVLNVYVAPICSFDSQLMHPILDTLDNTQHDWLKKLLFTFNEGNIGKFEALSPLFPKEVGRSPGEFMLYTDRPHSRFCMRTIHSFDRRSVSWH